MPRSRRSADEGTTLSLNLFPLQEGQGSIPSDAKTAAVPRKPCRHRRAIIGLDAYYCPDCRKPFAQGTRQYQLLLYRELRYERRFGKRWKQQCEEF